jgi:sulfur-carrier protein adenylyltransferase/sulfurtransferase
VGQGQPPEIKFFQKRLQLALNEVERALTEHFSVVVPMTADEARRVGLSVSLSSAKVWEVTHDATPDVASLYVSVEPSFPASIPKLFLLDREKWFLTIPHVNRDGSMCIIPEHATLDQFHCGRAVVELVEMAIAIIKNGIAENNRDDFIDEIESYWSQVTVPLNILFAARLERKSQVMRGCFIKARKCYAVHDSDETLASWVKNFSGQYPNASELFDVPFAWRDKALFPEEWPQSNKAALEFAAGGSADALVIHAARSSVSAPILLAFDTRNGPAVLGMSLAGFVKDVPGFRPHRAPASVLIGRFGKLQCRKHQVIRVDAQSISSRIGSKTAKALVECRVTLVGCGALGADVAVLLAKAGCGRFSLIDPEQMSWDNIGRHLLGAESVGQNKAEGVGQFLTEHFPHVQVTTSPFRLETIVSEDPAMLHDSDIILCLTGEWMSESVLNVWARRVRSIAVLFGWFEPHALAAHGLLVLPAGGCLACARNEAGEVTNSVIQWKDQQLLRRPACGGWFTPHGAADAAPAKAMIVQLAIDAMTQAVHESTLATYIGNVSRIKEAGGTIRSEWNRVLCDSNVTSVTLRTSWPVNPRCPQCN